MRKIKILAVFVIISSVFVGLTNRRSNTSIASRGKVIAHGQSGILKLKLHEAAMFNFQQADSTGILKGEVCILGPNDEFTNKKIKMVPRRFPSWFRFGCETGNIVEYKIVQRGPNNEPMALVYKFYR